MQLTKNFSLEEMTRSRTADKESIDNVPRDAPLAALLSTALGLEMVRKTLYDYPVTVHSGYRSPKLNAAVGGAPNSHHVKGFAADITVASYTPKEVAQKLAGSVVPFDQLIYEPTRGIVHVSFHPHLRGQVLTQIGGPGSPTREGIL